MMQVEGTIMYRVARHLSIAFASLVFALILTSLQAVSTLAFTWGGTKWPSANTTYLVDGDFAAQGSGWDSSASDAIANWNGAGWFSFGYTGGGNNHIQTGYLDCNYNYLAEQVPVDDGAGNKTQFTIRVNIGCGIPFYDGTQGPSLPSNYYDLRSVLRHELGHALGLCHGGDVMNATLFTGQVYDIGQDSSNGDNWLYQPGYNGPGPDPGCP